MGWTDGQTDRERRNGVRPGHLHQQTVLGPGWTELSGLKRKRERHTASLETWKRSQHGMLLDIESHCRLLLGNQSPPPPPPDWHYRTKVLGIFLVRVTGRHLTERVYMSASPRRGDFQDVVVFQPQIDWARTESKTRGPEKEVCAGA